MKLTAAICVITRIIAQLIFSSSVGVGAIAVETTARKRLGNKSFIQKKERGAIRSIASSQELQDLSSSLTQRKPGSLSYFKGWKHWCLLALESIRHDLSLNLPYPSDRAKFENLFFRLGVAADFGDMPSFSDPGARSGYALEFFCRARNLADLYFDSLNPSFTFPEYWVEAMMKTPMLGGDEQPYNMVSLGGGPGFDFVGAAMVSSFVTSTSEKHPRSIKATIFDYEEGWGDLIEAMGESTISVLQQPNMSCGWGGKCDITKSLNDPSNSGCLKVIDSTQLWTCQYCVAENANLLRDSHYVFFHDLFENARDGAIFIFTEVHPRIWPEFYKLMDVHCPYMQVGFNKNGRQMLLRKGSDQAQTSPLISEKDKEFLNKFEDLARFHTRKINSGWKRQIPKIRGS